MRNKKGLNFGGIYFWGIIAIILGIVLFKQFDFKNPKFDKPALAIVYIVVFIISIVFIVKDFRRKPEK